MGNPIGQGARRAAGGTVSMAREQVLDAAMAIIEAEGVQGLTVRGLAAGLSVAATSVYWHVGDKEALLDALAERVIDRLGTIRVRGSDPQARLRSAGRALRKMLREQADLVALVHRQGRTAALLQPARRVIVEELVRAGIDDARVAMGVQAILNHVIGSVLLERQVARQPRQRETAEDLWQPRDLGGAPGLMAALRRPVDEDRLFEYSLTELVRAAVEG